MHDETLLKTIKEIPFLMQSQQSLHFQLVYLSFVATKLGLYDASDFVKTFTTVNIDRENNTNE